MRGWQVEFMEIIRRLDRGGGARLEEIVDEGFQRRYWKDAVLMVLRRMSEAGLIIDHGTGRYSLPPTEEARVAYA